MFIRWLRTWRDKRKLGPRGLFRYHDGQTYRWLDPFTTWRAICHHPTYDLEVHPAACDDAREPETTEAIGIISALFDVQRFDGRTGRGLNDWEILGLLEQLLGHLASLKKNTSRPPTSPPPTESTRPSCSDAQADSDVSAVAPDGSDEHATNSPSGSGSTSPEPPRESPTE